MSQGLKRMRFMRRAMLAMDKPRLMIQGSPKYKASLIQEIIVNAQTQRKVDLIYNEHHDHTTPTCMMIHGGGLFYGDKSLNQHASVEMAKRGFNVINLDYPLLEKATLHDQLNDLFATFDFIFSRREEYQLSGDHVVMMGDSAGAYLSLVCSMLLNNPQPHFGLIYPTVPIKIKSIGLICIMVNLKREDTLSFVHEFAFKHTKSSDFIHYMETPLHHIKDASSCMIIGSEDDFLKQDSRETIQACVESNHVHEVLWFEKGGKRPLYHVFPITFPQFEESQKVFDEIALFFKAHCHPIV